MIQIDVELPDRPGELAKLAALLGDSEININAISAESGLGRTYMSLIVDQPAKARGILLKAGYGSSEKTVLVVRLPDRPNALATLARKLGDAGVDITSIIQLESIGGHAQLALGVDDLAKARGLV
ncbi:MAG TPA: ACT domain-containing protein [Thermoplasmata archaeon]|nr:ACT domain-containing protein [Thermoplasmata archaeon]